MGVGDLALTGGRRPRLGGREWFGWPHVRPARVFVAIGGSLTLATVVVGLLNAVSAQQAIALAVLATLATAGGMIGLVVPDAWAAWRRGFQQGFRLAMNRQARPAQTSHRARRMRKSVAVDRPESVAGDKPESVAPDDAPREGKHVIVSLPVRRDKSPIGKSSRRR
jgi:hypothetical protein